MLLALFFVESSIRGCTLVCSRVGARDRCCCCFVNCWSCIDCASSCRGRCCPANLSFAAHISNVSVVIVYDLVSVIGCIVVYVQVALLIVLVVVFVVVHVLVVCIGELQITMVVVLVMSDK